MATVKEIVSGLANDKDYKFGIPETQDLPPDFELPPDLTPERFSYGLSCFGHARLILLSRGGKSAGNIYEVWFNKEDCHAFVVLAGAKPNDLALNNTYGRNFTNAEVAKSGKDVTNEIFDESWERL